MEREKRASGAGTVKRSFVIFTHDNIPEFKGIHVMTEADVKKEGKENMDKLLQFPLVLSDCSSLEKAVKEAAFSASHERFLEDWRKSPQRCTPTASGRAARYIDASVAKAPLLEA
eukprot:7099242-Heterocapsa_arctica.AAC.1